jgi:hypothetical protein
MNEQEALELKEELKMQIGKAIATWAMKDVLGEIQPNLVETVYEIIDAVFSHR